MIHNNRSHRSVHESIEARLECVHNANDLRLEYLKLVYSGGSVSEYYRSGNVRIHVDCLRHAPTRWQRQILRLCCRLHEMLSPANRFQKDESAVLVFLGEKLQFSQPLPSVVRLRFLDQCNVCGIETFKIGLNPRLEMLWRLTDRELRSALQRRRMPFAKFKERIDKLIEGRSQLTGNDSDIHTEVWQRTSKPVFNPSGRLLTGNNKVVVLPSLKKSDDTFEVR